MQAPPSHHFSTPAVTATEKSRVPALNTLLMALPPEITMKIIGELDWYSLMNVRKVCKYLYELSKSRSVWLQQLHRYRIEHRNWSRLDAPLETYSASDLEAWITLRISADAGWRSTKKPARVRYISQCQASPAISLIPGGRWLLIGDICGLVVVYDLDASNPYGHPLAQFPDNKAVDSIRIDIDQHSTSLAFTLAVSSRTLDPNSPSMHIWAVALAGQGGEACWKTTHLRSFAAPAATTTSEIRSLTLYQDLIGRVVKTFDNKYYVEVFDWTKSTSTSHCKSFVFPGQSIHCIQLLRGNRLLAFSDVLITIYDVLPIDGRDPSPPIIAMHRNEPSWALALPSGIRADRGGISTALVDATATRVTFAATGIVYGLIIPHDVKELPRTVQLARFKNQYIPSLALGFEKMLIQHDGGPVTKLSFSWKEDKQMGMIDQGWRFKTPRFVTEGHWTAQLPVFDEGSGRVVQWQSVAHSSVVAVIDTAPCLQRSPWAVMYFEGSKTAHRVQ